MTNDMRVKPIFLPMLMMIMNNVKCTVGEILSCKRKKVQKQARFKKINLPSITCCLFLRSPLDFIILTRTLTS